MKNQWDSSARFHSKLDECVYGSRLLGSDPSVVLHGGGNTSVKGEWQDITGDRVETLFVKGSGWDLATIEAQGFAPLPLNRLRRLLTLDQISDPAMMAELSMARLAPEAPQPSVESLLHAHIPFDAVMHSHADAILALTNTRDGADRVRDLFGDDVMIVPYVMPGFDLAKLVARQWDTVLDQTTGMVLLHHGLITWGTSTEEAYSRHVSLIDRAEKYLAGRAATPSPEEGLPTVPGATLAKLRHDISRAAGRPMIMRRHTDPAVAAFVRRHDLERVASRGPLTPDHAIRTKRVPLVGRDVTTYVEEYVSYFEDHRRRGADELQMLDPAPRIVLDPELGMLSTGHSAKLADIAADLYQHTIPVITMVEEHLGGYQALPAHDIFDVEYWDLEQAKLRLDGDSPPHTGRVAVVTGAASGIGKACASALLRRGAAVIGIDISPDVRNTFAGPAWLGLPADVTDEGAVDAALNAGAERFGGVDLLVIAAGIFGPSSPISDLDTRQWRSVQEVNVDSVATLLRHAHPLLVHSPADPAVAVIASKNVPAPGQGAAAYSASKAALTQLARVAALEWAGDGIRVNIVHPDAVFDTRLWTEALIAERAARYGLTPDQYKRRNLLGMEVTSHVVGETVAALLGPQFAATTGAQIPVDGGSDRVI